MDQVKNKWNLRVSGVFSKCVKWPIMMVQIILLFYILLLLYINYIVFLRRVYYLVFHKNNLKITLGVGLTQFGNE